MIKKLNISENWKYYTYKNNYNLNHIDNIIKNTFLNYNILISNIYIYEYPKCIIIKFQLWVYNENHYKFINNIISYLKSLLILKYNKNIELNIKFSKDIFNDDLLIGTFIKKNNDKIRPLLKLLK
jgi:hypothetical protein